MRAPKLAGLYGRAVTLADGSARIADDTYLREKILNPNGNRLAEGYKQVMPSYAGKSPDDDLTRLINYLKADARSGARAAEGATR